MGTMLVKHGLPRGHNPELWMLSNPEVIKEIHTAYLEAGSQVILTNTFGANRLKLQEYHASSRVEEINITATQLARAARGNKKAYIAGTVGPTGQFPAPLGNFSWSQLVEVFKEQVTALEKAGVDYIFLETFSDLGEIRAALYAAKNYTQLPVACSLTYTEGRTLTGTTPEVAATVLSSLGADLIGANCSTGPQELLEVMKSYRQATHLPLLVEPNAGMPEMNDGITVYNETPENMAAYVEAFRLAGVNLIGACCGTTPEHIQAMAQALKNPQPIFSKSVEDFPTRLASRTRTVSLGKNELPLIIGERINPTARKAIAQAFKEGNWSLITQEGKSQLANGAQVLDLNVGVPSCDESILLAEGVQKLQAALDCPLVLDCTKPEALEKGLQEFQGKALINSVNGEKKSLENILPLAKKYGAAVIGLTLNEKGIPEKAEERFKIAEQIVKAALSYGIPKEDIVIDCLVLTAAASPDLARETCRAIKMVKQHLGITTVLGLSNVSHGLPQRSWLNAAFLALCLGAGLDTAIANPLDSRIKETLASGALLTGRDPNAKNYISLSENVDKKPSSTAPETKKNDSDLETLSTYIFEAQKEPIVPLLKELIKTHEIVTIINEAIIPPLEKIGNLFSEGEIFLPQLIHAGEATKIAFSFLKEQLPDNSLAIKSKGTIVIGTVQGDVHDIGKNIVSALLENHGYKVIDLGKNVPTSLFIETAKKENAQIVALSALMTTTMVEMKPVIDNIRKENSHVKVIVGGAVVTADYAKDIGADGYGKDAVEAVKIIGELLKTL